MNECLESDTGKTAVNDRLWVEAISLPALAPCSVVHCSYSTTHYSYSKRGHMRPPASHDAAQYGRSRRGNVDSPPGTRRQRCGCKTLILPRAAIEIAVDARHNSCADAHDHITDHKAATIIFAYFPI